MHNDHINISSNDVKIVDNKLFNEIIYVLWNLTMASKFRLILTLKYYI